MYSKLKCTKQPLNWNYFGEKWYFVFVLLIMPIIFVSLAHCTTENAESDETNHKSMSSPSSPRLIPVHENNPAPPTLQQTSTQVAKFDQINTIYTPFVQQESHDSPAMVLLEQATIVVDISEQQLYLHEGNKPHTYNMVKSYPVSTSKYGIGSQAGSNKTPLGRHHIEKKIGDGAPPGMIFKGRQNTGKIAKIDAEGTKDLVTTRIMWLKGLEPGKNSGRGIDSYQRYIYIHGTAEEYKIGQPASHGCVRMYNSDVIDLFNRVKEGTEVYIRR